MRLTLTNEQCLNVQQGDTAIELTDDQRRGVMAQWLREKRPYQPNAKAALPCPYCGDIFGSAELRKHKPQCWKEKKDSLEWQEESLYAWKAHKKVYVGTLVNAHMSNTQWDVYHRGARAFSYCGPGSWDAAAIKLEEIGHAMIAGNSID